MERSRCCKRPWRAKGRRFSISTQRRWTVRANGWWCESATVPRLMGRLAKDFPRDERTAVLDSQDDGCLEQFAQEPSITSWKKYQKACECLKKDDDELLAFYDFPAEHWGRCEPRTDRSLTPRTNIPSRKPDPRRQTTGVMINAHQAPNSTQPRTFSVAISSSNGLFESPDRLPTPPKPTTAGLLLPVGRDSWSGNPHRTRVC